MLARARWLGVDWGGESNSTITAFAEIPLKLIEIRHLCGTAKDGGSPLNLMVSDHASAFKGRRAFSC